MIMSVKLILVLCGVATAVQDLPKLQCTLQGERCVLPFMHQGIQYMHCAISDRVLWCPSRAKPEGKYELDICTFCEAPSVCYIRADEFPLHSWKLDCPGGCFNISKRMWSSTNDNDIVRYSVDSFVCAAAIRERKINGAIGGTVLIKKSSQKLEKVVDDNEKSWLKLEDKLAPLFSFADPGKQMPIPRLLFSNQKDVRVVSKGSVEVLVKNQKNVVAIALDSARNILYWSDVEAMKIFRGNLTAPEGGKQVQAMSSLIVKRPDGLAYDWIHKLLFWSDADLHTVSVSTDLGNYPKTLINRPASYVPRDIALDPKRGYMYVTDWGDNAKIEKCHMSGMDTCLTVVGHDIKWPNGIALDIENDLIYWVDAHMNSISVATSDGDFRRELVASKHVVKHPYSVMLHGNRLYWTDWNRGILSVDKETGVDVHLHFMDLTRPTGIALYDAELQHSYLNHCERSPCKYLCLPTPIGFECACPDGYEPISRDESDCKVKPSLVDEINQVLENVIETTEFTYDVKSEFDEEKQRDKKGRAAYEDL
ncbi:low-density lipoprotein receptor-like isoform X1 [Styela clava]